MDEQYYIDSTKAKDSVLSAKDYQELMKSKAKINKYKAKRIEVDGIKFDSMKEAKRYGQLIILVRSGKIKSFERQVKYRVEINGVLICNYIADFVVTHLSGNIIVEDVKGMILPIFKLKSKLMKAVHNIDIVIS